MSDREREVITDFIELYRDFPCLWDPNNESYKDPTQKQLAWEILVDKLKAIDPEANKESAKKRVENLKYSYRRQAKKVKESIEQAGGDESEVHRPNLWYYDLMTFLDKKSEPQRRAVVDPLAVAEDEDEDEDVKVCASRPIANTTMSDRERQVITEFIELYRDYPCLWDWNDESFEDSTQKRLAWKVLVDKLRTIDPDANKVSARKKIQHLKYSYRREAKKVKEFKRRTGADASKGHKPNLWYYNLMTFLDKKSESTIDVGCSEKESKSMESTQISDEDPLAEDEVEILAVPQRIKRRRKNKNLPERKKDKLLHSAEQHVKEKQKLNTFAMYVGEKLEQVSPFQRQVAEKLISDVIFLAATNNLNLDTRIETPSQFSTKTHSQMSRGTKSVPPPIVESSILIPSSHDANNSRNATLSSSQAFSSQIQSAPVKHAIKQSPSRYTARTRTPSSNSNTFVPSPHSNSSVPSPYLNTFVPLSSSSPPQQHSSANTRSPTPPTSHQIRSPSPTSPNSKALANTDNNDITIFIVDDNSVRPEGPDSLLKELLMLKKNP